MGMNADLSNGFRRSSSASRTLSRPRMSPTEPRVERHGAEIVAIELNLPPDVFLARRDGREVVAQHKSRLMVRGIALKTASHPLDRWVEMLCKARSPRTPTKTRVPPPPSPLILRLDVNAASTPFARKLMLSLRGEPLPTCTPFPPLTAALPAACARAPRPDAAGAVFHQRSLRQRVSPGQGGRLRAARAGDGEQHLQIGLQGGQAQPGELDVPLTQALYQARELAMERMEEEADALGADGIVAVRLTFNVHAWGSNIIEFVAIGTAVHHLESKGSYRTVDGKPFTSDLSGQDFWTCSSNAGYRPPRPRDGQLRPYYIGYAGGSPLGGPNQELQGRARRRSTTRVSSRWNVACRRRRKLSKPKRASWGWSSKRRIHVGTERPRVQRGRYGGEGDSR